MPSLRANTNADQESHTRKEQERLAAYFDGERSIHSLRGKERTRAIAEAICVITRPANGDAGERGMAGGCPNYEYIKAVLLEMGSQKANIPGLTQEDIDKAFIYAFDNEMLGSGSQDTNGKPE